MKSINQQINLPAPTSVGSRQGGVGSRAGMFNSMPNLAVEDWSMDFYNDYNMYNACGGQHQEYSNLVGGAILGIAYPTCIRKLCRDCKNECKTVQGLAWRQGGSKCFSTCRTGGGVSAVAIKPEPNAPIPPPPIQQAQVQQGVSTEAMIGIGLGGLLVVLLIATIAKK